MDENERKRKRELGIESDAEVDGEVEPEQPGEGLRKTKKAKMNQAKGGDAEKEGDEENAIRKAKAEKRKEKRQQKKEKIDRKREKKEAKKEQKQDEDLNELAAEREAEKSADESDSDAEEVDHPDDVAAMDFSGLADPEPNDVSISQQSSAPTSPDADTPTFDLSANQSAASSSSSVPAAQAPSSSKDTITAPKKEKALNLPQVDQEELQSRLRQRIEELRARRKADGPEGRPARNRQELLEARRKKEEARKAHKKELRLRAKQEEERQKNERLRGSGSPLSSVDIFSPRIMTPTEENNFSFGRVAFEDGFEADAALSGLEKREQKKGKMDPKAALEAAEKKAARLAGYDEEKRKDIESKDAWLNAKKRAHGERVKDDASLLKKALKRKEQIKLKSAQQWNERIDNVRKGKEMKDKKRTENLNKRRDEKGQKGKKKAPAKKGGKKGRPGFEGKFGGGK